MNWYRLADALSLIHKHASANIDESVWMDGEKEGGGADELSAN